MTVHRMLARQEARMFRPLGVVILVWCVSPAAGQNPATPPFLEAVRPSAESRDENPFENRIETDRDAFTPTPKLIGPGRLGIESAYSFVNNRGIGETHSFPELLVRYGLTRRVELRLGWNYEVGGESSSVSGAADVSDFVGSGELEAEARSLVRESTLSYGVKVRITEQAGWLPETSAILVGQTPTGGPKNLTQAAATYVVGWELPNRWKLDAAFRYATAAEEGDRYQIWSPSTVLRIPVGDRVTAHAEYFGFYSQGREANTRRHFLSGGASYLITPDLEIGVRGGPGLNDESPFWFVNAGFGWRF
jgi:hypothetical protein